MTIWFTADTHFNHFNILEYCDRPFSSVEEMNNIIIERWNSVVGKDDTVYHLGDFTLMGIDSFKQYIFKLNGKIKIVPGGHDHRWLVHIFRDYIYKDKFEIIDSLISLEFPEHSNGTDWYPLVIVLCHYALRVWDRSHYNSLHLYGHSHGNLPPLPNSMDVGVDCHNFYPISLEQVLETLR